MPEDDFGIRVEGVRDLIRTLRQAEQHGMVKELGQSNKEIGTLVIQRLRPLPATVGAGAGARVRPSATARLVQLRAGGRHREVDSEGRPHTSAKQLNMESWGRVWKRRGQRRPHIVGSALQVMPDIERRYLGGIKRALPGLDIS